jgi:hypothetical protein
VLWSSACWQGPARYSASETVEMTDLFQRYIGRKRGRLERRKEKKRSKEWCEEGAGKNYVSSRIEFSGEERTGLHNSLRPRRNSLIQLRFFKSWTLTRITMVILELTVKWTNAVHVCSILIGNNDVSHFWALSHSCEKRLLASSCLNVRPNEWNNTTVTANIFVKFDTWVFFENLSRKIQVSSIWNKNNG